MTQELELNMYVLSNIPGDEYALNLLTMLTDGFLKNQVGIMRAREEGTDKEVLLIVGIEEQADGPVKTYPLARVLSAEEGTYFSSPDGFGGYQAPEYHQGLGE